MMIPATRPYIPAKVENLPLYDDMYKVAERTAPQIIITYLGLVFLKIRAAMGIEMA